MKRIIGWGIGVFYLVIAFGSYSRATRMGSEGHGEFEFWWMVVATLLFIASLAAFIGTLLHTQEKSAAAH